MEKEENERIGRAVDPMRSLIEKIRALEGGGGACAAPEDGARGSSGAKYGGRIATGWPEIDAALDGGLIGGALHEWFGLEDEPGESWTPPLCILLHLARRALDAGAGPLWLVWIGRRCLPYPGALVGEGGRDRRLLERSLWVSINGTQHGLWAIDQALRCPAVGAVIAEGAGFDMAATRRVQLAARTHGTLAMLVRPPAERAELSAAQTRWGVRWAPAPRLLNPVWSVELLRCKGSRPDRTPGPWRLEWDRATSLVRVSAPLADSPGAAAASTRDFANAASV
jgi:protein ImuA